MVKFCLQCKNTFWGGLHCPKCKGELRYDEENKKLICESCLLKYPIKDDIPVMLIDEAEENNVSA